VDGPDSPHHGRAGWTWYTGSAQWLHRVVTQYVLGVRTEWDGLHVQPCLPLAWARAEMVRPYRGSTYHFVIERAAAGAKSGVEVTVDGVRLEANVIGPPAQAGTRHEVHVRYT